jgi:hypothetical protein
VHLRALRAFVLHLAQMIDPRQLANKSLNDPSPELRL